jgi:hypothetical protein
MTLLSDYTTKDYETKDYETKDYGTIRLRLVEQCEVVA